MRRNAARIGLVGVLALSMGVATATAPPARADDPTSLIAPARSSAGLMNYAVNLSPGASPAELERALALVPSAHGVALASYPQIGTFFAQSESASFAPDIAEALAGAGIKVHSVGPTRVAPVPEGERAAASTPGDKPAPEPTAPQSGQGGAQSGPQSGAPTGGTNSVRDHDATEAEGEEDISNWGAAAMSAREAGAVPVAHAPVTVGVIDTGIDDMHPDLAGRVDQTRSVSCAANGIASQGYGSWRDDYFHGTHVAGIIAANHNSIGIDGIAPDATLVSIKAANSEQLMYPEYVTCGFMWAASHGVDIVNNSYSMDPWMYWSPTDPEQAAGLEAASRSIAYAQGSGLAVIASAGNEGADNDNPTTDSASPTDVDTPIKDRPVAGSIRVPGQVAGVSQVSALKRVNEETKPEWTTLARADFSNYGTTIDFAAPGDGIYSTVPTSQYASGYAKTSGTSMAAPHITGIAALIKATHPAFTGAQIVDLMRKQAAVDYTTLARANAALAAAPKADGAQASGAQASGAQGGDEAGVTPDPQTSNGWHLQALRALEAQGVDVMRAPVTVGVMDQSIDDTVPDLAGQVDHSKSVACNVNGIPNQDPAAWRWDDATHGTHVAGSIAAKHDGVGVDGVNPTLRIAAINVASRNGGYFYPEYIACGFVWAAEHGISVTNGSYYVNPWKYWMPNDPEQAAGLEAVQRAADYATSKDVINVVAAGNWTTDLDNPPATDDSSPGDTWGAYERDVKGGVYLPSMMRGTLAVSALQLPDGADPATGVLEPTSWSNWGASTIDFAAPGAKIYAPLTSWYGKAYGNLYGTSQAAPLAAAVIATLRQVHPEMNASEIVALAKKQASAPENWSRLAAPVEGREYRGAGLPNVLDAVLKDQATPVIGTVEYSTDGSTWMPLAGESVAGRVSVRVSVSGPVTSARLLLGDREIAAGQGSGDFSGPGLTLQADGVDVSHPQGAGRFAGATTVTVEAFGRNFDPRADDDATVQVPFTVSSDHVGPDEAGAGRWVSGVLGWWWRYDNGTYPTSTQLRIDGAIYRFDAHGYMVTGWVYEGGRWFYYGPSGGQVSGWVRVAGSWYYLDPLSGAMASGWTKVRDTWYYLSSSGAMRTGWVRDGSSWYYLSADGAMATGWVRYRGSWFYLSPDGAMATGWLRDGGSWFYLSSSGVMVTGSRWIDGTRYSFDAEGRLLP